jgi:hypothetical protein
MPIFFRELQARKGKNVFHLFCAHETENSSVFRSGAPPDPASQGFGARNGRAQAQPGSRPELPGTAISIVHRNFALNKIRLCDTTGPT